MRLPLLVGLLGGCAVAERPPAIELGGGELSFEAIAEGADVQVIQGPQGGHHVLASVRVRGIDPGDPRDLASPRNPEVKFALDAGDGCLVFPQVATIVQGLDPAADPDWDGELIGRLAVLDIADDTDVVGRDADFSVRVIDGDGEVLTDARRVHLVPHPFNE